MIHYNVWFALKEGIAEDSGLMVVDRFLRDLSAAGEVSAYRLLRNTSEGARTKMPKYHAVIEFADEAALSQAMKNQTARGIHTGDHGQIISVVSEFRVEIFRVLAPYPTGAMLYACEI
ncbi:MAG: DUF6614 family protein [Opitutaceae bacterium]